MDLTNVKFERLKRHITYAYISSLYMQRIENVSDRVSYKHKKQATVTGK